MTIAAVKPLPPVLFDQDTHTYTVGGIIWPSVTQILGVFDHGLDRIDQDLLDRKSMLGRAVHRACELDDKGELDRATLHPVVAPYLEQWRKFRRDLRVEVLDNEHIVVNPMHKYVGTNDRLVGFSKFSRAVLDIKSGMKRRFHEWQTGGYKAAADRYDAPVDGRCCLYLTPDKYRLEIHEDPSDPAVFLNMAAVYYAMKKKGVIK